MTHGVIFDFCKKILNQKYLNVLGNGSQKKPYVYVKELVSCMIFLSKKKTKYKIYLCGPNDKGVEVRKIANEVVRIFKSKKKIIYGKTSYGWKGDVPNYNYNVSRLNKEGFKFKQSSLQAVQEAIRQNKLSLLNEKN